MPTVCGCREEACGYLLSTRASAGRAGAALAGSAAGGDAPAPGRPPRGRGARPVARHELEVRFLPAAWRCPNKGATCSPRMDENYFVDAETGRGGHRLRCGG